MRKLKNLILAAFLACTLVTAVYAGDMGSPGVVCTDPGDTTTSAVPEDSAESENTINDATDSVILEIASALIKLF